MLQTTPFALLTLKESGLTTIKSLRSKKIGLHNDGQKAIDVLLQDNGMSRADVTILDVPYTLDPLISGEVDAMQGYIVDEAVQMERAHHPVNVIPMSENGYVSYAEVLFTSARFLKDKPDVLVKFLRATNRGWREAVSHPAETAKLIVAKYLPEATVADQEESILKITPLLNYETRDDRLGFMKKSTWDRTIEMFNHYQLVGRAVSADNLVTYSILDRLYPGR
jgi:ABC-type nitrate/sulfonate/bicarbonate transport system substrate-binding protein